MLTDNDLKRIGDLLDLKIDKKFEDFAVLMQSEFSDIHKKLDYLDNTKADKSDIARLEGYIMRSDRRVDRLEDDMRVVKTKLELA
ncbi:MAG: hypothetical protein ACI9GH_000408 [Candidatus Paceibacteria bacterium]|jgi:hypothetical protein